MLRIIWRLFVDLDGGETIANNNQFDELLDHLDLAPKRRRKAVNWLKGERLLVEQESRFFDPEEDGGKDEKEWKYTTIFQSSLWDDADKLEVRSLVDRIRSKER